MIARSNFSITNPRGFNNAVVSIDSFQIVLLHQFLFFILNFLLFILFTDTSTHLTDRISIHFNTTTIRSSTFSILRASNTPLTFLALTPTLTLTLYVLYILQIHRQHVQILCTGNSMSPLFQAFLFFFFSVYLYIYIHTFPTCTG